MNQTKVRTLFVAFGPLCVVVLSLIAFLGDSDHYEEMDEIAGRFESNPTPQHLRDLLNYPADGAYAYYKMALVGASFVKFPNTFQKVASNFRTSEERKCLQMIASSGAGMFEYHPELKPKNFEERFEAQHWLATIQESEPVVGGHPPQFKVIRDDASP